ncbi:MAG: molybdopterin oxidoreductase family protein [SAR324 cluster bacterium]|nr:molybdopterin oxidoreductase family protein [SAR324 cluster bacterium]
MSRDEAIEHRISVCAHDCPDTCSIKVGVRDGRIISITGDEDHPITRGFLCGKVNRYAERVYSPLRIKTPLRRIAAKGEGRFAPISWDEALDEIASRFGEIMAAHGAEAILPYSYGGTIGQIGFYIGHRFFHRLGASRLERTICTGSAVEGLRMTMGIGLASDIEEIRDARLILVWGLNAVASHVHLMPFIRDARRKGARLVVIDTYRNATARQADWFIPVRPGTDAALALGMMREIIAAGLHDENFIDRYTVGFEDLRQACQPYTPQRVQEITGVPAQQLVTLARDYGRSEAAFIRLGLGLSRHSNGAMTVRSISCLPALTGAWERRGGGFLCFGWGSVCQNQNYLRHPAPEDPPARSINMVRLGEALLETRDPEIKALYVYNSNPAAVVPEQARVHEGLAREDLFCVVHEQLSTDTTDFADIVLPATTFMEHDDVLTSYGHNYLQISRAAIPAQGQAKSNLETFSLLARRMGLDDPVLRQSFQEVSGRMLAEAEFEDNGDALARLEAGQPLKMPFPAAPWRQGLATPSGKFEFYSSKMEALGHSPVPAFVPSREGHLDNALKARYPLQLVTPPSQHFLNSSFGEAPSSLRLEQTPRIKLNPADAAVRGLVDGASCRAFNDRGECFLTVEVTGDTPPGTAVAESVWWPKLHPQRKGINQLTSAELTDLGRCARFHDGLIEVEATQELSAGIETGGFPHAQHKEMSRS